MIFRVTTEGEPIRHIHFCFDAEGLDTFLTDLSSEHFWWPYLDASEEETAYWKNTPQHIGRLDVFVDDGSFPALRNTRLLLSLRQPMDAPANASPSSALGRHSRNTCTPPSATCSGMGRPARRFRSQAGGRSLWILNFRRLNLRFAYNDAVL